MTILAWACLAVAFASTAWIAIDVVVHPQQMGVMSIVWPTTALYAGPLAVWAYHRFGRLSTRKAVTDAKDRAEDPPGQRKPFAAFAAVAATHCGSGCTLGDLIAESTVAIFPVVLTWFGYRTLWEHKIFSDWVLDFILAYLLGIVFQYFTIAPMRNLGVAAGIWAAVKADTLSLTAWQIGMYGWMAIATFVIFGHELSKGGPVFWFMMQIAMLCGLLTAYPVNWWLVRSGIKEKM